MVNSEQFNFYNYKDKIKCLHYCDNFNCKCKKIKINNKIINIDCNRSCKLKNDKNALSCKAYTIDGNKIKLPPNYCRTLDFNIDCTNNISDKISCFQKLWKINGCSNKGSEYPSKNNTHNIINSNFYYDIGRTIKKLKNNADLGDKKSIIKCIDKDYNKKICGKSPIYNNGLGYYMPKCLQYLWKKYGCSSNGIKYPSSIITNYEKCNNIKKCNVFDRNNENDICWEKCSLNDIKKQLTKLKIYSDTGADYAQSRCTGNINIIENMSNMNIDKYTILFITIIAGILLYLKIKNDSI